jgi:phosphoenolpyruvate synthase/pyruvate phosphate dikinase
MVHTLENIQPEDVETHGGKAANLAKLTLLGFLVPRTISISSAAFVQMIDCEQQIANFIQKVDNSDDFEEILEISESFQKIIADYSLPESLETEISEGFEYLQKTSMSSEHGFAVRSSATIEDRSDISFAGQAESYLCVTNQSDVFECVKKVWQSAFSEHAIIYLKTKNIPMKQVRMAVVVQEMIPANISGVMFTANVVNNRIDELLINATWGLGDALVSGKLVPDTYILRKNPLSVVERILGEKKLTSLLEMNQLILSETPKNKQSEYTLDDRTLVDIAEVGMKIESAMESPQDIEWCIKPDGALVILQSRPITTLNMPSSHEV